MIVADTCIRYNGILGIDFMTKYSCDILVQKMCFGVKGQEIPCFKFSSNDVNSALRAALMEDVKIPPNSEYITRDRILDYIPEWDMALIEPNIESMGSVSS